MKRANPQSNYEVVRFKYTYTAFAQCFFLLLASSLPLILVLSVSVKPSLQSLIGAGIPASVVIYVALEKVLPKRIVISDDRIKFYNGPFNFQLETDRLRVCYEKVPVLGGNYKDYFGLVLYRSKDKIIGFSINNRFVLSYEMDEIKLEHYQKEFTEKLGIEIHIVKPFF